MHDELSRKNEELFRSVVTNTYLACARRGEAAVRALIGELRTHAHLASEHMPDLEAAEAAEMQRRAKALQESTEVPGEIVLWNGHASSCLLHDRSCLGARLKVESVAGIPDVFTLKTLQDGKQQPCRVAWRKQNEIGVNFLDPLQA